MITQIPSSPPEVVSQTPGEQQTSSVIQHGAQFQQKLCALLSPEDKIQLEAKNKRTKELLKLIQKEVQKRREEIGYDYEIEDYNNRLCISDEEFEKILRKKVLIGDLGEYYTELTSIYGESPIILKKLLREYYIEDLVYESVEKYEEKEVMRIREDELKERLDNNRWDDLQGVKSINLSWNELGELDKESLKEIFHHLQGVKSINLSWNELGELDKESLKEIFRHLQGVKSISLRDNNLGTLDKDTLKEIFRHLQGVKSISLRDNNLGTLDKDSLKEIFRNLQGVKSIDLGNNNLGSLDKESLKEIFRHLQGVKTIDSRNTNLGDFDKESLKEIFHHLQGVKSIDLSENNLGKLDKDTLKEIFSNLKGVKSIDLGVNNLTDEQKDLIRQLLPDAEIQF